MKSTFIPTVYKFLFILALAGGLSVALCLLFGCAASASASNTSTAQQPTGEQASAPQFPFLRLEQHAKPPALCDTAIYGAVASRAPDGALCLCHQGSTW